MESACPALPALPCPGLAPNPPPTPYLFPTHSLPLSNPLPTSFLPTPNLFSLPPPNPPPPLSNPTHSPPLSNPLPTSFPYLLPTHSLPLSNPLPTSFQPNPLPTSFRVRKPLRCRFLFEQVAGSSSGGWLGFVRVVGRLREWLQEGPKCRF